MHLKEAKPILSVFVCRFAGLQRCRRSMHRADDIVRCVRRHHQGSDRRVVRQLHLKGSRREPRGRAVMYTVGHNPISVCHGGDW